MKKSKDLAASQKKQDYANQQYFLKSTYLRQLPNIQKTKSLLFSKVISEELKPYAKIVETNLKMLKQTDDSNIYVVTISFYVFFSFLSVLI